MLAFSNRLFPASSPVRRLLSILFFGTVSVLPTTKADAALQPAPPAVSDNRAVLHLVDQAQSAVEAADLQKALTSLKLAVSMEPKNPLLRVRFGTVLNLAGDYPDAEEQLRIARNRGAPDDLALPPLFDAMLSQGKNQVVLDLFPDPGPTNRTYLAAMILRARASAMQSLGDSAGATTAINRSLDIYRDYDGVMTAGRIALLQQDVVGAAKWADAALLLKPNDADAIIFKIDVLMQIGRQAEGLALAEKLVADRPRSVEARLARIKTYLSMGLADKAKSDVDRILAQKPDMLVARYYRALILARSNNPAAAWAVAHSLPGEYLQSSPEVALNVADMAIAAGFLNTGSAILNRSVLQFPTFTRGRLRLADILLKENSPRAALNTLALVEDSKDPQVAILFARAYLAERDTANAHDYMQRAIELGGGELLRAFGKDIALQNLREYVSAHQNAALEKKQYAVLLLAYGDLRAARAAYEDLVRSDPTDAFALNNLAWLVVKDDPRRALALAEQAVKQAPSAPHYLDTLGSMQMNLGDPKSALATLRQAHLLLASDGAITYHLALALEASGAHEEALTTLQSVVSRGGFGDLPDARRLLARWQAPAHTAPGPMKPR